MSQAVRLDAVGTATVVKSAMKSAAKRVAEPATKHIATIAGTSGMRVGAVAVALWLLVGCTDAAPPPAPPSTPAAATAPAQTAPTTPLGEAVRQPIDDARRLREATEEAAREQRREIDAATGG